jgi:hypothetical protein
MKISVSMELIWQLASQETVSADLEEIGPNQFFAALLKFAEIPAEEVERYAPGADVAGQVVSDVQAVRVCLQSRSIPSTEIRRRLRELCGRGNHKYEGGLIHRSKEGRDILDLSARIALESRTEMLAPLHLLQTLLVSPTMEIRQVLSGGQLPGAAALKRTPLLDKYGTDLRKTAAQAEDCPKQVESHARAILQVLVSGVRKGLLLIGENESEAMQAVRQTARLMETGSCPSALKACRLVDLSGLRETYHGRDWIEPMQALFAEADGYEMPVWLVLPSILPLWKDERQEAWLNLLKTSLSGRSVRWICGLASSVYSSCIAKESEWKHRVHPMWISQAAHEEIPREL